MITPRVFLQNPSFCCTLKLRYGLPCKKNRKFIQTKLGFNSKWQQKDDEQEQKRNVNAVHQIESTEVWTMEQHDAPFYGRFSVARSGKEKRKYRGSVG